MKKKYVWIAIFGGILVVIGMGVSKYNGMVTAEEGVSTAWSNVETQYQRRADLIPNLVNTVKGYATHETKTLQQVMEARASATQIKLDATDLTAEKLKKYQVAQGEVTSALGRLMMVSENYPNLKADRQFETLQIQLEGTENRIAESRRVFNISVQSYNTLIRRFPNNIIAGICGFSKKDKFEATAQANQVPEVKF